MKISNYTPTIESSGQLEEQLFSIGDPGMIFEILRSKMYSNPILAICREYSCNALDAHREVGKHDLPIEITLPTGLEPFYKIKDFGPGLGPDRIANVFIKYCASTKRDDNEQIGAFGLGAKSAFSYTDTFTIVTYYNGKVYNYVCFIDETKVGKLNLLSESTTNESNGTEIIIPVKPNDFRFFSEYTERSTRYWDIKPIIKGAILTYQKDEIVLEGKNWKFSKAFNNKAIKAIIGGIEYPIEIEALRKYASADLFDNSIGTFILHFENGELSLSANREQIYLDDSTQGKIKNRLQEIVSEIKSNIDIKINTFDNLWDAKIFFAKTLKNVFHRLGFLGSFKWNNISLTTDDYYSLHCPVFNFSKGRWVRGKGHDPDAISCAKGHSFRIEENSLLVINDLDIKKPSASHIKKAFDDLKINHIYVVCPTDKVTLNHLNASISLDKMKYKKLSDFTKASGRKYTPTTRMLVFKYESNCNRFCQVSYSDFEDDTNNKIICKLKKETYNETRQLQIKGKSGWTNISFLQHCCRKNPKISFYGIDETLPDEKFKENFADLENIEDFITKTLSNNIDFIEIKYAKNLIEHQYNFANNLKAYLEISKFISDKNNIIFKYINLLDKYDKIYKESNDLLQLQESYNGEISKTKVDDFLNKNPRNNVSALGETIRKQYPLLKAINEYNYSSFAKNISEYINLVDKE